MSAIDGLGLIFDSEVLNGARIVEASSIVLDSGVVGINLIAKPFPFGDVELGFSFAS